MTSPNSLHFCDDVLKDNTLGDRGLQEAKAQLQLQEDNILLEVDDQNREEEEKASTNITRRF